MNAPVARNPFATAPPPGAAPCGHGGGNPNEPSPTGPLLGPGSGLDRMYSMPAHMGHSDSVDCMVVVEDKVYTGGRDQKLMGWRGVAGPNGSFEFVQDGAPISLPANVVTLCYDPATKWLLCGLWSGDIHAYCRDPVQEDCLVGHKRSVQSIVMHAGVVVSGSNDTTVRLWTRVSPQARFQCHGAPLKNPLGSITAVRVLGDGLWAGAQNGITCFDLGSLQTRGTIPSTCQVTGMVEFQNHMFAAYRNGDIRIFDAAGNQVHFLPSRGEHTSNTSVEIMMHPVANVPMLLCGQQYGYITAYDLPSLNPRGSFVCEERSDVKAIVDAKFGGVFLTAGLLGDIMAFRWGAPGAPPPGAAPVASSPFAPGGGAAPAPMGFGGGGFGAPGGGFGAPGGDMMS